MDRIVEASNGAYLKYRAYTPNYLSPYGYAINNPINYYDPNGLDTTSSRWEGPVEGGYPIAYNPSWGERGSELNKGLRDLNLLLMGSVAAGAGAGAACGTMSAETMRDVASVGYDFYFPVVTQVFCGLYQVGLLGVG